MRLILVIFGGFKSSGQQGRNPSSNIHQNRAILIVMVEKIGIYGELNKIDYCNNRNFRKLL